MKKIFIILAIFLVFNILFSALSPNMVWASSFTNGLQNVGTNVPGLGQAVAPQSFAANLVKSLIIFVGIIFMILLIYAGALYMFSQGDAKKAQHAKTLIMTAVIGLVIILTAYAIAYFVTTTIESSLQPS